MINVVFDEVLRGKLGDLKETIQLVDESGRVKARIVPELDPADWEPGEMPDLSPEELQRRLAEPGGKTTSELLEYLRQL